MNTGLISLRYANSLLQYATGLEQQDEVYDRMKVLSEMFTRVPKLRRAIMNPSLLPQDKKKIFITACGGSIPSSLSKMFDLILKNEREDVLLYITLSYIRLYRYKFNIRYGKLITAVPINDQIEKQLADRIRKMVEMEVELDAVVDPGIIGGFVLTLGDFRWDASISGELTRIRNQFR